MSNVTPMLEARGITKKFGGVLALDRVDFSVGAGEVVALAGDNGAGKSTLIKIISGVFPADAGDLQYNGNRVTFANPHDARDRGIETIYQDLALADNLDVGANVFLGREPMTRMFGILPVIDRKLMRAEAAKTLDTLDIGLDRRGPVSWALKDKYGAFRYGGTIHDLVIDTGAFAPDTGFAKG